MLLHLTLLLDIFLDALLDVLGDKDLGQTLHGLLRTFHLGMLPVATREMTMDSTLKCRRDEAEDRA